MPTPAPPPLHPADPLAPGRPTRLGRYALRYRVADGGMASVYLAQLVAREGFHKWVAIKTIHPHIAREARFVQMFLNEARLAARLDHPNICQVFDFGEADGTYYLAMEYLHGEPLSALIRRELAQGGMPREVAVRILADTARGLHAAHELRTEDGQLAGVVHRDVSPQNVFVLYSGVTKVVDFGVARSSENLGEKTKTGELRGKLAYMSPEQIEGESVDRRTDVWALGVVLWEATTSKRLFKRPNDAATLRAVAFDAIPAPRTIRADYPAALEAIVMRALERDPAKRYATAQQLARELEQFLAREGSVTTTDEVGELMQRVFADRIAERQNLLRRENVDAPLEVLERSETDRSASESQSAAPSAPRPASVEPAAVAAGRSAGATGGDPTPGGARAEDDDDAATVARTESTDTGARAKGTASSQGATGGPSSEGARREVASALPAVARPPAGSTRSRGRGALVGAAAVVLIAGVSFVAYTAGRSGARSTAASEPARTPAERATPPAVPSPPPPPIAPPLVAPPAPALAANAPAAPQPRVETNAPAPGNEPAEREPGPSPSAPAAVAARADASTRARASTGRHGGDAGAIATREGTAVAAPAAADTPPAAARVRVGTLTLLSDRAVRVYEGSSLLGTTPLIERSMSVGSHSLRIVPVDGGPAQTIQVEVESGAAALVRLRE